MKKLHPKLILIYTATLGAVFTGCNEQTVTHKNEVNQVEIDSTKTTVVNVSGKIFSIPSPILTAMIIKESDSEYTRDSLHDVSAADQYSTSADMALNLGVYGTDMAYASLYDDGQASIQYFNAINHLSEKLNIKGALDVNLLKRIGENADKADSLLVLSGKFYRDANYYLRENERYDIASLVLAGGWIESSHLSALAAKSGVPEARKSLADQQKTVGTICEIIAEHCDEPILNSPLYEALKALNKQFESVERTYKYEVPETDVENKTTIIKSKSTYTMSDEVLEEISNQINELRNLITK